MLTAWILIAALFGAGEIQASSAPPRLLIVGDSLSAAYGMPSEKGWVALLQPRLAERGWDLVNASMSGETTSGGLSRLSLALDQHAPRLVMIELGANDALRGLPLELTERNLRRMVMLSREAGAEVLLVGMQLPPNFGEAFTRAFAGIFRRVSETEGTALLPFLLEPVADSRETFQADQIHPTAAAQPRIAEHVWQTLEPLLERSGAPTQP